MRTHHPWRPRMDSDPLLNPFAPVTHRSPIFDRVELAETEEEEDEGAQYAFQVEPDSILILAGQHLYPSSTFPCLKFDPCLGWDGPTSGSLRGGYQPYA